MMMRRACSSRSCLATPPMLFHKQLLMSSKPATQASVIQDCNATQFYEYTSGRWLWNEEYQFARRHVEFNLAGLLEVSAKAIGAQACVKIEKLPEGNFSKVFLVSTVDGRDLIAKLPNPNAGQPHLTTASEVATMDYARNTLGIPAPQVYGWSSSKNNPVGTEYILMERSRGIELTKIWDTMSWEDKYQLVKTLVGYEKTFVSTNFPMYGSLYYAKDISNPDIQQYLDHTEPANKSSAFVIGPTTNRAFFDLGRDGVDVNRGPWSSVADFVISRAERELACTEKFSSYPDQQGMFGGPNQYSPSGSLKSAVLRDYMKIATHVLPKDTDLSRPTMWHSDLHTDNIFVDSSQPTQILSIIDWQAINISPLFLQARHPSLIEFEGPIPKGLAPIELPAGFDDMTKDEQLQAKTLRAAQSLFKLYEILMLRQCPQVARALRFRDTLLGQITGLASSIFSDGEPILQGMLIRLEKEWKDCVGLSMPCPLSFTTEEISQQQDLEASWCKGVELMHELLTEIGAYQGWDGWVSHDNFSIYKERLHQCRENFLNTHAKTEMEREQWIQAWPFQDKTNAISLP